MDDINQRVLACPMQRNDAAADTVGEYLITLLFNLWGEGEGFNSKRPFGNSSWHFEIYEALGRQGIVEVEFDEDGYINDINGRATDRLVADAIKSLLPSKDPL